MSVAEPVAARRRARPPLDPRLLRYSPATRVYVVVTAALAAITVVSVIVTAAMTASILAELVTDPSARSLGAQAVHLWVLVAALVVRVITSFAHDRYAHRASATAIAELRARALGVLTDPDRVSPRELLQRREHATTVLLRGLDALRPYLSAYLPALIVTVLVTPTVVAVIGVVDWPSAVIILVTLPLIPLFMILIGVMTRDRTERKLATMSRLSAQLLDLITGLPTLRALGRARTPARQVADLGQSHRRSTMSSLRIAFLSGGVLELLATLCVALVAVGIGLRLVYGDMSLYAGVLALILAPEAYLPLRQVGAQFHNSADGVAAAGEVADLIESGTATTTSTRTRTVTVAGAPIRLLDVGVHGRNGWAPYELTATAEPGALTVFSGPNGSGKTTTIAVILGLLSPDEGSVLIGSVPVAELEPTAFHEQVAWLPQQPVVVPGTVADNLAMFGALDPVALRRASATTGFDAVVASLPDGDRTVLGAGGTGLSAGQRQRLALTRVLASPSPLLILDEPTAHLDADAERGVLAALAARAAAGDTVIVVAHRPVVREFAGAVIDFPEAIGVG
ncbi:MULTISPECIES: thiol reductant ABC exporter subunit CydD [unclassified Gordonia (in: high G+C Gram-positive bacteria)]